MREGVRGGGGGNQDTRRWVEFSSVTATSPGGPRREPESGREWHDDHRKIYH